MTNLSYNELKQAINSAPMSWLPGLLLITAQACKDRHVFQSGAAVRLVQRIENENASDASQLQPLPAASPTK